MYIKFETHRLSPTVDINQSICQDFIRLRNYLKVSPTVIQ